MNIINTIQTTIKIMDERLIAILINKETDKAALAIELEGNKTQIISNIAHISEETTVTGKFPHYVSEGYIRVETCSIDEWNDACKKYGIE